MNYIKTNNKWARQRGTTLIELSVVIAVILLLVGVLFIGIQAWKDGANKAACLVNISSVQKAVRGYENLNGKNSGDNIAWTDIAGAGLYFNSQPICPAGGAYTLAGTIPAEGSAAVTCSLSGTKGHAPTTTANW
jgi:prepilin-type N-terminal cleavage/methylation domain-containing protein